MIKPKYFDPNTDKKFNELHSSCWLCGPSGVRWCLENGYDPNAEDDRGWTPIIWLVRMHDKHTRSRKRIFRMLVKHGADIGHVCPSGDSILDLAEGVCSRSFNRFIKNEYRRYIRTHNVVAKKFS